MTLKITLCICIHLVMQEPSPSLRLNPESIWWFTEGYMQWYKLTGSTGFAFSNGDVSCSVVGSKPHMLVFNCGITEPSLIRVLPGREVPCGIWDIPGTISRDLISSPNVVTAWAAASSSVCGWTMARTLNLDVPYLSFLTQKYLAASSHPRCVNSSSFICFCRNLSMHCCTVLVIVPITQPGSSSSLLLPCFVSSSSSSSQSSPLSEPARSLRLSPIAISISSNVILGSPAVNLAILACFISSCYYWTAASVSSTRFPAPAVSLST